RYEPDQLGEGQRHQGEIVAAQAEGGKGGAETDEGGDRGAQGHAHPRREAEVLARGRGGVGAQGEEARVSERDLPRVAGEEIPARSEERPEQRVGSQNGQITTRDARE